MKRRRIIVVAAAIAAAILSFGVGALILVATGAYNIAATTPHAPGTRWLLNTMQQRSVAVRADDVPAPPPVDSAMVKHGFEEYHEMCVACHGAPGIERGALGKGMNPRPPDLAKKGAEWSDRELFWITKHGIKLAGMPAFGVTHSDTELWGIVAFVRRLQRMPAEEYRRMAAEADAHGEMQAAAPHAHGAVQGANTQARARGAEMDHGAMDHARATDRPPRAGPPVSTHQRHQRLVSGSVPQRTAAEEARFDVASTEKLKALAAELLRDTIVLERVRADSALQRHWESESVRRQLTRPR
jgi:mono/diheme cytochrome c family protein